MTAADVDALLPLVWVGAAILLLGFVLVRLRRAGQSRPASALPPFLRHFEAKSIPAEVSATVFRQLQHWMQAQDRHFAVRPDQRLDTVYGLLPEELDAALARMAAECGLRFHPDAPRPPLETVSDLVTALARCPEAKK